MPTRSPLPSPLLRRRSAVLLLLAAACLTITALTSHRAAANPEPVLTVNNLKDYQLEKIITDAIESVHVGVAVPAEHTVLVPDPRASFAYVVLPDGEFQRPQFRLDRSANPITIPPDGHAIVRDLRDQLFIVYPDGKYLQILDP
ncbi:MAG: hypothetical protein AAGG38_08140 [Planctomycetota bacterium]